MISTARILGAVLSAALALTGLSMRPAGAETLADAMVFAYRNSNLLDQNQALLRAADEDVATAISALRPIISYAITTGYLRNQAAEGTTTSPGLDFLFTLYDFGRNQLSISIAKEAVLATREALVEVEQGVLLDAVRAYMDVRSATEIVAINENSVKVIGEALRAAQDRFEVGAVTRTDVSLAEARLAAAKAGLVSAQGQLAIAREAYRAATGRYPGSLAPPPRAPKLPKSLAEAQSISQRSRPSLLQQQHQVKAAELQVDLAAKQRLPSLDLAANLDYNIDNDQLNSNIGVELNQTIYAGGRLSAVHRRALASRDAARSGLLQTSVGVTQQVGNAWATIDVARAQIEAADLQITAATDAYEGTKEEALLGARTTLDVLDAEQEVLNAQASRITAEADLQVAFYSLLSAMGLLTAERLNLGIPTYDPDAYYNAVKNAPTTSVQGQSLDRVLKAIGKN